MNLEQAKAFLDTCERDELNDYSFGDSEVSWLSGPHLVADGYFGSSGRDVTIYCPNEADGRTDRFTFTGDQANALRYCGKLRRAERNDSGVRE